MTVPSVYPAAEAGTILVPLNSPGAPPAIIDAVDAPLVASHKWHWHSEGYAATTALAPRGPRLFMHRLIMDAPPGLVVHHVNGNRLDNRRRNLRLVTRGENGRARAGCAQGAATPLRPPRRPRQEPLERFWAHVSKTDTCWLWTGRLSRRGYGQMRYEGRKQAAHRVAYQLLVGPIPPGMTLDHLCRTPACVNPAHLEPVSASENSLRSWKLPRRKRGDGQTHCKRGHRYDDATVYVWHGQRHCRRCDAERQREQRRRKALERVPPATVSCSLCERPATRRGWCNRHYMQWYKHGGAAEISQLKGTSP